MGWTGHGDLVDVVDEDPVTDVWNVVFPPSPLFSFLRCAADPTGSEIVEKGTLFSAVGAVQRYGGNQSTGPPRKKKCSPLRVMTPGPGTVK